MRKRNAKKRLKQRLAGMEMPQDSQEFLDRVQQTNPDITYNSIALELENNSGCTCEIYIDTRCVLLEFQIKRLLALFINNSQALKRRYPRLKFSNVIIASLNPDDSITVDFFVDCFKSNMDGQSIAGNAFSAIHMAILQCNATVSQVLDNLTEADAECQNCDNYLKARGCMDCPLEDRELNALGRQIDEIFAGMPKLPPIDESGGGRSPVKGPNDGKTPIKK